MQKYLFIYFFFVSHFGLFAQRVTFPDYHAPLDIPLVLAGNFGELRPNHFHMGVDFKTLGKEGFSLHAIEEGFVSRVKVSTYGYGKAVYIDHPDGTTSVYAHCSKFLGRLDSVVKAEQYRTQNFEVERYFHPNELPLKKGEVFALSGNTGGSTAPHLHFEVRDTKTEFAKNPLVYAFDLPDTRAPELRKLKLFAVNEQGFVIPGKSLEKNVSLANGLYSLSGDTLVVPSHFCSSFGGVGLAFDVIDRLNGAENPCGLYGTYLIVEGDTIFGQQTDAISFDHSRYVNSHRDMSAMGSQYHKSFRNSSNPLEIYRDKQLGVIHLVPGQIKKVEFVAYDPKGNQSKMNFFLAAEQGELALDYNPSIDAYWYPNEPWKMETKNWTVEADSFSIYEPYLLPNNTNAHVCDVHTHMQKKVQVRMKLTDSKHAVEKYYIAVTTKSGVKKALPTVFNAGWLEAKTNNAGSFSIQSDVIAPVIKPLKSGMTIKTPLVKIPISDALSGLADCDLFIDGEWHLMEYEYKGAYAFFEVPKGLTGLHEFCVVAVDACGNVATWEQVLNVEVPPL